MRSPLVDTADALLPFLDRARATGWCTLDTEFLRESTYYPALCLIQFAIPGEVVLVDPVKLDDPAPLARLLSDDSVIKVLHAARQDIEILRHCYGAAPKPLFDTQIAAALLGDSEQIGYAALVEKRLGIKLEKGETRSDWCARPLSDAQIAYARDDVDHLCALYTRLADELDTRGRRAWLEEECAVLATTDSLESDPMDAWRRIKPRRPLSPADRARLQALAAWREGVAREQDRPRGWIVPDEALVSLAHLGPGGAGDLVRLNDIPELAPNTRKRLGAAMLETIDAARDRELVLAEPPSRELMDQAKALGKQVDKLAVKLSVSAPMLATRTQIMGLIRGDADSILMKGWRRDVVGDIISQSATA